MTLDYKKHNKKVVIYSVKINNKLYVGSTVNFYFRIKDHFYRLKKGCHGNSHLQRAYNKYNTFEINIVRTLPLNISSEILLKFEKHYIDLLKPEFNIVQDPRSPSLEDRKRISNAVKKAYEEGRLINPWSLNGNKVDIYNYTGKLIYNNVFVKDAINILKVSNRSVINNAIKNKRYLVRDFLVIPSNSNLLILLKESIKINSLNYRIYRISSNGDITLAYNKARFYKVLDEQNYYFSKQQNCLFCYVGFIQHALTIRNNSCILRN